MLVKLESWIEIDYENKPHDKELAAIILFLNPITFRMVIALKLK